MIRREFPGYWEGVARPDGGFVLAKHNDRVLMTHVGTLVCPDLPRFPDIPRTGTMKIAVQGDGRTREWVNGEWLVHREACGIGGPVIYDRDGVLHIADCAQVGAAGYRYVAPDGRLVTGDESNTRAGSELRESTDLGDGIFVGQGPQGGIWAQLPDGYRLLGPGITMRPKAMRVDDAVSVAWYEPTPGSATAHVLWTTLSELRAMTPHATTLPPVTYAPVVAIGRPLWMGWFFGTDMEPANCHFIDPTFTGHTFIQGPDWRYVAGASDGNVADIEAAITGARPDGHPVLAYVPRGAQHALPTSADIQGIEAYLGADETDEQFLKRIRTSIRVSPRAVLIANCYTSNTTLTSDLRRVPGLISQLARDHANVEGILVFSGSGRATGWQEHPEVHDAWRQVFAGITGVPSRSVPTPEPTEPNEPEPVQPEPPFIGNEQPPSTERPTMTQPPFTRPEPVRVDKPIGGNAIADFFRALGRIDFRKVFKGWFK